MADFDNFYAVKKKGPTRFCRQLPYGSKRKSHTLPLFALPTAPNERTSYTRPLPALRFQKNEHSIPSRYLPYGLQNNGSQTSNGSSFWSRTNIAYAIVTNPTAPPNEHSIRYRYQPITGTPRGTMGPAKRCQKHINNGNTCSAHCFA